MSSGDIDELKFMRTWPDRHPGYEANYKPEPEEPTPSTRYIPAGAEGNTNICQPCLSESFERHRCRQAESRERRQYAQSLDPSIPPSPTETFPSPVHHGTLPAPSAEADTTRTNRLTIEQYRERNEEVSQRDLRHTPTFDENDEELDYYCEQASQELQSNGEATASVTPAATELSEPPVLEDEAALLQGPGLPSTFTEEAALLYPTFASTLSTLKRVPVQFLDIVANRIDALRRGTAWSLRPPPGYPPDAARQPPQFPALKDVARSPGACPLFPTVLTRGASAVTPSAQQQIYNAASNLGTAIASPRRGLPSLVTSPEETNAAV